MKKKWETPRTVVQGFEPNEYVAACWGVQCDVNWANCYEKTHGRDYWNGVTHATDHCGNSSNQVIFDDNGDGVGDRMIETGTDGLGDLTCNIFWDENFRDPRAVSSVNIGDTIYWTTTASDGRTWNHKGTVGSVKNFVALVKNGSFLVRITDMTILIEKEFIYGSSKRPNPTDYYRKQHYQCG